MNKRRRLQMTTGVVLALAALISAGHIVGSLQPSSGSEPGTWGGPVSAESATATGSRGVRPNCGCAPGQKCAPPSLPHCPSWTEALVVPAAPGTPGSTSNAARILSAAAVAALGSTVRFVMAPPGGTPVVPSPFTAPMSRPNISVPSGALTTPASAIPFQLGGQVAGKGSCDFMLSDNPPAEKLAAAGARALAKQGTPTQTSGATSPGEQRYLLKSGASLSDLAYILYIVPDPTSGTTGIYGPPGAITYTRNLYAIAVVATDGSIRYVGPIADGG